MSEPERERKKSETVVRTELVLPYMTNVHGTMFGGRMLEMMDMTCAIAAMGFCRKAVVTISSEHVDFKVPIRAGSVIEMKARIVFTGRTSMTVKADVYSKHRAEEKWHLCTTGYFNFVALDRTGKRTIPVPALIVETEEEQNDWKHAEQLRKFRLKQL